MGAPPAGVGAACMHKANARPPCPPLVQNTTLATALPSDPATNRFVMAAAGTLQFLRSRGISCISIFSQDGAVAVMLALLASGHRLCARVLRVDLGDGKHCTPVHTVLATHATEPPTAVMIYNQPTWWTDVRRVVGAMVVLYALVGMPLTSEQVASMLRGDIALRGNSEKTSAEQSATGACV